MITESEKPNMPKLTQYGFTKNMSKIKKTVFIKGKTIIFVILFISHLMILITIIKAATFGNNVAKSTAKDVPSIPHVTERG